MVFEGQVEEGLQVRLERQVKTVRDRPVSRGPRQTVGGEGVGRAAVDVARKLVEEQDEGQGAFRRTAPACEVSSRRLQVNNLEAYTDGLVELRTTPELRLFASVPPEADDFARGRRRGHGRPPSAIIPPQA